MKPSKTCPECGAHKPAAEFGTRSYGTKTYLTSYCRPCIGARQRARRATPEGQAEMRRDNARRRSDPVVYARQLAAWRERYHTDEDFRHTQLEKSRAVAAANSTRVQRIHRMLDHFEGREGWLRHIAEAVARHPQAQGLQYLCQRIDEHCADYLEI